MTTWGKKTMIGMIFVVMISFTWIFGVQPQIVHSRYTPNQKAIIQEKLINIVEERMNGSYMVLVKLLQRKATEIGTDDELGKLLMDLAKNLQSHYESPKLSAGCGKSASSTPTQVSVNGTNRSIITYVGSKYNKEKPIPLIIAFHGRTNSNAQVQKYYGFDKATQGQAIIVYPSGLPEKTSPRNWRDGNEPSDQLRDFALFDAIVEEMSKQYCIDRNKIYVVGHSLGAWFSNTLACARGDTIRAIGTVGGGITRNECQSPTAAIIMHNPEDRLSSFTSGIAARDLLLEQNKCSSESQPVGPSWGNCVEYTCNKGNPVVWCPHSDSTAYNGSYYPHTRPDNAGQEIWSFFQSLP